LYEAIRYVRLLPNAANSVASLIGRLGSSAFRLSTTTVSMSLAGSCFSSESAPGPSIMGVEDGVEQSFGRPCCQRDGRSKRPSELTSSIVPRGTSFHRRVELEFPPIGFDPVRLLCCYRGLFPFPAESVPSTQMRCMITANRRASATIAFFIPRRLAICIAQALSQDHFLERIMA
jgi:hypothetical protein